MSTESDISVPIGPSFSKPPRGEVMFSFVMDRGSVIGPRPATDADRAAHPEAWADFLSRKGSAAAPRKGRSQRVNDEPPHDLSSGR